MGDRRRERRISLHLCWLLWVNRVLAFPSRQYSDVAISRPNRNLPYLHVLGASRTSSPPARHPKESGTRKESPNRRPRFYWTNPSNIEHELRALWESKQVPLEPNRPPPIPNESLLNYWNRHDLRGAIVAHGGRDFLSESLGGAQIIPGVWMDAVKTPYVQHLLEHDAELSSEIPPLSPQQRQKQQQQQQQTLVDVELRGKRLEAVGNFPRTMRWSHCSHRKPPGYWSSLTVVVMELYQFLEGRRLSENIPESWMPRLSQLEQSGRIDLAMAIHRFGGTKVICRKAGLIPFREWNYVEGMYEMLLGLKEYLDEYRSGDYKTFPVAIHLKERGKHRLYSLIQYYGGVKFLSARLDMEYSGKKKKTKNKSQLLSADMSWGAFDLEFAIELYSICREQQLKKKPPLKNPEIRIPSQLDLLEYGTQGRQLDEKIQQYGGYENVARRLGLGFSFRNLG